MKYEAVEANSSIFEVRKMCQVLGLKAPNYYRWKKQREKNQYKREEELKDIKRIETIFLESDKIYGYRMIAKELEKDGQPMCEYRIRRIMKENGFYPETRKKYKPTHNGKTDGKYCENIVKQNFKVEKKNEIWVGDITYIKTTIGWAYLAIVIDLFNREVIGYSISKKIDSQLVKSALANAIARNGTRKNMIFHSDRGCQYASKGYYEILENNGIKCSMSRPGCPYDNSCAESFFATIKKECIYRKNYNTIEDVKKDMFRYIELFYNRKRMHSVLGYLSPVEYRLKYGAEKVA
jgi:transposase InsO family protein